MNTTKEKELTTMLMSEYFENLAKEIGEEAAMRISDEVGEHWSDIDWMDEWADEHNVDIISCEGEYDFIWVWGDKYME